MTERRRPRERRDGRSDVAARRPARSGAPRTRRTQNSKQKGSDADARASTEQHRTTGTDAKGEGRERGVSPTCGPPGSGEVEEGHAARRLRAASYAPLVDREDAHPHRVRSAANAERWRFESRGAVVLSPERWEQRGVRAVARARREGMLVASGGGSRPCESPSRRARQSSGRADATAAHATQTQADGCLHSKTLHGAGLANADSHETARGPSKCFRVAHRVSRTACELCRHHNCNIGLVASLAAVALSKPLVYRQHSPTLQGFSCFCSLKGRTLWCQPFDPAVAHSLFVWLLDARKSNKAARSAPF